MPICIYHALATSGHRLCGQQTSSVLDIELILQYKIVSKYYQHVLNNVIIITR